MLTAGEGAGVKGDEKALNPDPFNTVPNLTDNPSEFQVAGGVIRMWGRLSAHAATGAARSVVSTQMTVVSSGAPRW